MSTNPYCRVAHTAAQGPGNAFSHIIFSISTCNVQRSEKLGVLSRAGAVEWGVGKHGTLQPCALHYPVEGGGQTSRRSWMLGSCLCPPQSDEDYSAHRQNALFLLSFSSSQVQLKGCSELRVCKTEYTCRDRKISSRKKKYQHQAQHRSMLRVLTCPRGMPLIKC
jgi:hypothetical protein